MLSLNFLAPWPCLWTINIANLETKLVKQSYVTNWVGAQWPNGQCARS